MASRNEVSSGAVVFRKGAKGLEFLVLVHREGHYDFPKGHVEKWETFETAMERELQEETGIEKARIICYLGKSKYTFRIGEIQNNKTVHYHMCETDPETTVIISGEHKGFRWLSPEDLMETLRFKGQKEILSRALKAMG